MNRLRKTARCFLAVALIFSMIGNSAVNAFATSSAGHTAQSNNQFFLSEPTKEEVTELSKRIQQQGFGGKTCTVKVLLNSDAQGSHLLAFSENGYLIVERGSYRFCECGEGNPYAAAANQACYYGGPFCYFTGDLQPVASGTKGYYNLMRGETVERFTTLQRREDSSAHEAQAVPAEAGVQAAGDLEEVFLPYSYQYIRRRAFGFNDNETCSAVATGIALGYLMLSQNMKLFSDAPEPLDKGLGSKNKIQEKYPNAFNIHQRIVVSGFLEFGMGPASFDRAVDIGVDKYMDNLYDAFPATAAYDLDTDSPFLPDSDKIRRNIEAGKPVLVTTSFWGEYKYHTMCVYGHREVNGDDQIAVHIGWWNECSQISGNKYVQNLRWIDEDYATWGYYFNYKNPLAAFKDLPRFTDPNFEGILYCVDKGLMNGTSKTTFSPNGALARAMMATILYRAAGSPSVSSLPNPFTDVPSGSYYYNAVRWAYKVGITNGTSANQFSPSQALTRSQLAVMLFRYATYKKLSTSGRLATNQIADWAQVQPHAQDAVRWATYNKLLTCTGAKQFRPQASATRAETAQSIYMLLKVLKK